MNDLNHESSDVEIVEKAKSNPDSFGILVKRYSQRLFRYVKRISYFTDPDIEDILQEAFIKAYRNLNDFDTTMKFSTWMYQITRNTCIDSIRKHKSRPSVVDLDDEDILHFLTDGNDPSRELRINDSLEKIKIIIHDLPLKYREVMVLKFLEEKSYEEIMDIIKKPKGTVASLINRGRKLLTDQAREQKCI
jgi:RNA polymerase sigma-70 factor (ECF subfamily)